MSEDTDGAVGRCVSGCTIALVTSLYITASVVYHWMIQPPVYLALLFNFTWLMAMWSYIQTAFTDPGTPKCPEWQDWSRVREGLAKSVDQDGKKMGWAPGKPSWCAICRRERPERAHHCSSCGCCILRMDHHCPWIGSCVGWRNHKYFLLLNWWTSLSCLCFLLSMTGPRLLEALEIAPGSFSTGSLLLMVAVLMIVIFLLLTGILFCISLHLAMRNITTIEDFFSGENPYMFDSSIKNLTQLLGPPGVRWLVPVPCACRPCDGTSFPLASEVIDRMASGYGTPVFIMRQMLSPFSRMRPIARRVFFFTKISSASSMTRFMYSSKPKMRPSIRRSACSWSQT